MAARRTPRAPVDPMVFAVPAGAPSYCMPLDGMGEVEAREIIAPGQRYAIGPADSLMRGGYFAAVEVDGAGGPFKVRDAGGHWRGTFASWAAAAAAMVAEAIQHEADLATVLGSIPEESL